MIRIYNSHEDHEKIFILEDSLERLETMLSFEKDYEKQVFIIAETEEIKRQINREVEEI